MSTENILKFRKAFVRSVAEAWFDPSFKKQLLHDPVTAMKKFGFDWPWAHVCKFKVIDGDHNSAWLRNQWVTSAGLRETLTLRLPLEPRIATFDDQTGRLEIVAIPPDLQAMALADFYRQQATLFGDHWGKVELCAEPGLARAGEATPSDPRRVERLMDALASLSDHAAANREPVTAPRPQASPLATPSGFPGSGFIPSMRATFGAHSAAPTGGFIPQAEAFQAFQVAIVAALAAAWADDDFARMLELDVPAALRTIRGYEIPWAFLPIVKHDPAAVWIRPTSRCDNMISSCWMTTTRHELVLNLPRTPDVHSQAVAIAVYNAAGAAYPFTCCL